MPPAGGVYRAIYIDRVASRRPAGISGLDALNELS
jgi:hypothetical protein